VFGSGNRGFQPTGAGVEIHDVDVHGCWVERRADRLDEPRHDAGAGVPPLRLWDGLQYNIKGSQDLLWVHHCDIGPGDLIDFRNGGSLYYDSGQSKFTNTGTPGKPASGIRLNDNVWHDTTGHALWMDIDNINGIAQRETYRDIGGYGVHYEISYAFQVLDSLFERCRQGTYQSTAQDMLVQGCTFRGCVEWASRIVDDPNRPQTPPTTGWVPGGGAWPAHRGARGSYRNNDYWLDVAGCQIGIQGWPSDGASVTSTNQWDGNRYHLPNAAASVFVRNGTTGYSGWRGKGQDSAAGGARFYGPGKFTRAVSLSPGQNTVTVIATDRFSNRTQKDVSVIRGADTTPPTLIVSTPSSDTTVPNSQTTQTVAGTVSDNAAVASVTVNGSERLVRHGRLLHQRRAQHRPEPDHGHRDRHERADHDRCPPGHARPLAGGHDPAGRHHPRPERRRRRRLEHGARRRLLRHRQRQRWCRHAHRRRRRGHAEQRRVDADGHVPAEHEPVDRRRRHRRRRQPGQRDGDRVDHPRRRPDAADPHRVESRGGRDDRPHPRLHPARRGHRQRRCQPSPASPSTASPRP
jgi:hypothetical protein